MNLAGLLQNPNLTKNTKELLLDTITEDKNTTTETLQQTIPSLHTEHQIMNAVKHPNITAELITEIAHLHGKLAVLAIAEDKTPPNTIDYLLDQYCTKNSQGQIDWEVPHNTEILWTLKRNNNLTAKHTSILLATKVIYLSEREKLQKTEGMNSSYTNPDLHAKQLNRQLLKYKLTLQKYRNTKTPEELKLLAQNRQTTPKQLIKLYKTSDESIQHIVLAHPNCPPEILTSHINHTIIQPEPQIYGALSAIKNPNCPTQTLYNIWNTHQTLNPTREEHLILDALLSNPHIGPDLLQKIWDKTHNTPTYESLKWKIVKNDNFQITNTTLEQICDMEEEQIHLALINILARKKADTKTIQTLLTKTTANPVKLIQKSSVDALYRLHLVNQLADKTLLYNYYIVELYLQLLDYPYKNGNELTTTILNLQNTPIVKTADLQNLLTPLLQAIIESNQTLLPSLTTTEKLTLQKTLNQHNITLPENPKTPAGTKKPTTLLKPAKPAIQITPTQQH